MRLDKYLVHTGYGTRSAVQQLIKKKKVKVNGAVINKANINIKEMEDEVTVYGEQVNYRPYYHYIMNKPQGVITATKDDTHRTIIDLLSEQDCNRGVVPVGRLDKDTEGLIILTSDGKFNHSLMSPKRHVSKCYYAEVKGELIKEAVQLFEEGMVLKEGTTFLPAKLEIIEHGELTKVYVTLHEGKFHQVKRMIGRCGGEVVYLRRISMGALTLPEDIDVGTYRALTEQEIDLLTKENEDDK